MTTHNIIPIEQQDRDTFKANILGILVTVPNPVRCEYMLVISISDHLIDYVINYLGFNFWIL